MLIPDAFVTNEIHATDDYKEYETVFVAGKKRKQNSGETSSPRKSLKLTIKQKQVVEGGQDKESYASKFAASMLDNDADDSGNRHQGYMIKDIKRKCMTTDEFWKVHGKFDQVLHEIIPQIAERATNRANDPALWDVLKHDDAPPEGEKRVKRSKTTKRSKFAWGSSSKHLRKDSTTYVSKQQSQHQEWDAWEEENVVNEDEVLTNVFQLSLIMQEWRLL
ncbi:hypothetical protein Tco_1453814 [Tanacetum coccineum]